MDNLRFLNPDDFRRWMKDHQDDDDQKGCTVVGMSVEARHCGRRTARIITLESGRAGRVVREFIQGGGVVRAVEGEEYLIEVPSGSFYINRKNVIC